MSSMLTDKVKELCRHSAVYSIAWFSSSIASILLLPIYTSYLTKADYGILEMLEYTNSIIRLIILAGFHAALSKFYNEAANASEKRSVVSTATFFVFFSALGALAVGCLFSDVLAYLVLGDAQYSYYIQLALCVLVADVLVLVGATAFAAAKRSGIYIAYSIGKLVLAVGANLFFIVGLRLQALGMLYGNLLAMGTAALVITGHNAILNGLRVDVGKLRAMLRFGLPMVPASLAATLMHNADRFLIRKFGSLADVGIYGLGYKFPFMLNVLVLQSFNMIWTGATMYDISRQQDANYQYGRITTYFMVLYISAQLALSVFSVDVVRLLADDKFFEANAVIPLVSLGLCFHAFYTFFTVGAFVKGRTWLLNLSYIPAAAINICLNVWLLPRYGYIAAAWVTVGTYFTFSTIAYFACRNTIRVHFEFERLGTLLLLAVGCFFLSRVYVFDNFMAESAKSASCLVLYCLALGKGMRLSRGETAFLRERYLALRRLVARSV